MKYDYKTIYNKHAAFFNEKPLLKKILIIYAQCAAILFIFAYAVLWLYALNDNTKNVVIEAKDIVKIFCVPTLAFVIVTALRYMIDRPRPYAENGAGITPLEKKRALGLSFPSRHMTCGAVIAMAFMPYIPVVSALLFILTLALGYARFAVGWHYPADLFAGFALGILIGLGMYLPI